MARCAARFSVPCNGAPGRATKPIKSHKVNKLLTTMIFRVCFRRKPKHCLTIHPALRTAVFRKERLRTSMSLNAYRFSTYRDSTLRTVGLGLSLPAGHSLSSSWAANEAQVVARAFGEQEERRPAAWGKVFFLGQLKSAVSSWTFTCYQVKANEAMPVFCGNSLAAACAILRAELHSSEIGLSAYCGNRSMKVSANSQIVDDSRIYIEQKWSFDWVLESVDLELKGAPAVACSAFNDYLVIRGPVNVEDALALLRCHFHSSPIVQKLAIIEPACHEALPVLKFYTCNGQHGAAPQTGLAVLALLALQKPWLARIVGAQVATQGGFENIPLVRKGFGNTTEVFPPGVAVALEKIGFMPVRIENGPN